MAKSKTRNEQPSIRALSSDQLEWLKEQVLSQVQVALENASATDAAAFFDTSSGTKNIQLIRLILEVQLLSEQDKGVTGITIAAKGGASDPPKKKVRVTPAVSTKQDRSVLPAKKPQSVKRGTPPEADK